MQRKVLPKTGPQSTPTQPTTLPIYLHQINQQSQQNFQQQLPFMQQMQHQSVVQQATMLNQVQHLALHLALLTHASENNLAETPETHFFHLSNETFSHVDSSCTSPLLSRGPKYVHRLAIGDASRPCAEKIPPMPVPALPK